jgi:hypothetical protein
MNGKLNTPIQVPVYRVIHLNLYAYREYAASVLHYSEYRDETIWPVVERHQRDAVDGIFSTHSYCVLFGFFQKTP